MTHMPERPVATPSEIERVMLADIGAAFHRIAAQSSIILFNRLLYGQPGPYAPDTSPGAHGALTDFLTDKHVPCFKTTVSPADAVEEGQEPQPHDRNVH